MSRDRLSALMFAYLAALGACSPSRGGGEGGSPAPGGPDTADPRPDTAGDSAEPPGAYAGGWPIGACVDDVVPTGDDVGDVANDFALLDQFGEEVRLHAFCDRVVYAVFGAFW